MQTDVWGPISCRMEKNLSFRNVFRTLLCYTEATEGNGSEILVELQAVHIVEEKRRTYACIPIA
jgi:hypothetical protein